MAHIDALIEKVADPALRQALREQVEVLTGKRSFGLVFQEHRPETVELPNYRLRRGCKVRVWGEGEKVLHHVDRLTSTHATITSLDERRLQREVSRTDLVVVREFGDPIYPGLEMTGKIERGGDKPAQVVINAENFHALETLLYTHENRIDAIYIDPPYNTRDKDWKYNNDYVDSDDVYRHSKWLAMMQRRLELAVRLMNPDGSVLIVTIDEKEYLRLGLLLEQTFPDAHITMVSSVISSQASVRDGSFSRCNEYIYFVVLGTQDVAQSEDDMLNEGLSASKSQLWFQFVRTGKGNLRADRKDMFYPIFANPENGAIVEIGSAIPLDQAVSTVAPPAGMIAVWPYTADGREGRWRTGPAAARARAAKGLLRLTKSTKRSDGWSVMSVNAGTEDRIASGEVIVEKISDSGAAVLKEVAGNELRAPKTVWNKVSHNAGWHGSKLLAQMLPGRTFPYPKSLYAVEDALRFFVAGKKDAVILDFFAGSGTTAHAVMRLNHQDQGRRRCILVTNNEVSVEEAKALRAAGHRPGSPEWEAMGICNHVTKPRMVAAITGETPSGNPIPGDYKFADEFPIADGFEENAVFFDLTYEDADLVNLGRKFHAIAPLLWLKAGGAGAMVSEISTPWSAPAEATYGVLFDTDHWRSFVDTINSNKHATHAFVVTESASSFQQVVRELSSRIDATQLYSDYLRNFEINTKGRA